MGPSKKAAFGEKVKSRSRPKFIDKILPDIQGPASSRKQSSPGGLDIDFGLGLAGIIIE